MSEAIAGVRENAHGPAEWLERLLAAERGRFVLWLPVFMGGGVLFYFDLRSEPPFWAGVAVALPALAGAVLARPFLVLRSVLLATFMAASGFGSAQFATARALPIEILPKTAVVLAGTVKAVEFLPTGRRVSLEDVRMEDGGPALSRWVRVRLRKEDGVELGAGDMARVRALIRAPSPPAYPGAWDRQREAFFNGMGASGFALGRAERLEQALPGRFGGWVEWLRGDHRDAFPGGTARA
jgi:competence protein ComEC